MNALGARRTLVTGASRPLGIELVRQCLIRGDTVYASCRNPARVPVLADLRAEFGGLELIALDPADPASVADAVPVLESLTDSLDLLVLAPAEDGPHERPKDQARDAHLPTLTSTGLTEHYRRHAVAPVLLARTLLPWLARGEGARVLMVSTSEGSLTEKISGGAYAQSASAAGLHMLTRTLAHDLAEEQIVVCLGNGGVIDKSAEDAGESPLQLEDIALGLLMQCERLPRQRSGHFVDWTGAERAW
ncbi:MAG: SDR family NAD(P)-dependent oxidoreductase [Gemmatimonadaceae bacterium]|nr:SDR family NAD(P)-dependent oxidoreductase [Gemmatimonadaceae bacterium]